jgi:iron complex outermembrane receptor protein
VPAGQPCHAPQDYLAGDSLPNFSNKDTYSATLTMNWNSEAGKITSITGYKTFELSEITDQTSDITFGAGTDRKTHAWQYSEEVRDALQPTDNIEVLVGAFGMLDHYDQYQKTILQISLPGYTLWYLQNQNNWSASVFSQAYWHVTPTITLQGGVRVQHERTAMTAGNYAFLSADGIAVFDGGTPLGGFSEEKSKAWNNVGGKFGVDWQVTPTLLGYANYSRGFKSGGFVGRILLPTDIGPFNPEHVDTVEVGMKSDWLDHRLRANVAVFDTLYSNMQVAELYFTTTASGATANGNTILNAAKSSIRGTEIELTGAPTAQLLVHASIAYLDAHYTDFPYNNPTTGKLESLNGYALQNSPKWSATTGADYRFESRSSQTTFGAQYRYTSTKYNNAIDDTPRSEIQETGYIDANIEWALKGAKWSLNLWGRNLADRRYIDSSYDAPGTYAVVSYAAPREFGLTFKYAW